MTFARDFTANGLQPTDPVELDEDRNLQRPRAAEAVTAEDSVTHDMADIRSYLAVQEKKSLLRFLTCGSVDDGKSTLIGRLLYDTKLIFDDQLATLERDSRKHGTNGDDIDFALLVDGLEAEREQGITIDVAYRFFATPKRKFIVADTPGHEQYTRNMATGASTADVAVVLVDARQGVLVQTRRHSIIASLLGIRHVVLAINKIDLVGFDEAVFETIKADYQTFAQSLGFKSITPIPMSARFGDNVTGRSQKTPWYSGPALLEHLETIVVDTDAQDAPFRFPVQYVNRPNQDFRGFAGTIASGTIAAGDEIIVAKSGKASRVKRIVTHGGDLERAIEGQAVTIVLADEVEVSRGNMLVAPQARPNVADQFAANIVWFDEHAMLPGRSYILRTETDQASATITELKHRIDVNSFAEQAARQLAMNEVGVCNISTQSPIVFDGFAQNRATGSFILIDRVTNATVGAGMFTRPLQAANIHWQSLEVNRDARAGMKGQKPTVLWFTGLSGSGKSTIANLLEKKLHAEGKHTYMLDGDNVRHGLNRDLGFTEADRAENIRRVAEVARLMADAGLIVIVSFISPFRAERDFARSIMGEGEFVEVFVDTPFDECAKRDPKGLYQKALSGALKNFTGLDSPYEVPEKPEIHLETLGKSPEEMVDALETWLRERENGDQEYDSGGESDAEIVAVFERLAIEAGKLIMDVYDTEIVVDSKADQSPVTAADHASERLILEGLRREFPDIPCVAEEEIAAGAVPSALGDCFILVDPLDGTREFVSRRPDFTVNIALVRKGVPDIGVVYAPARGEMHSGYPGHAEAIKVGHGYVVESRRQVHVRTGATPLTIVASRSHGSDATDLYIRKFEAAELVSIGSSLKFCMIACAEADLYPRFGRTMEWDTAAGDAVLRAAGGTTTTVDGAPLTYGKRNQAHDADFANPHFIAKGRVEGC